MLLGLGCVSLVQDINSRWHIVSHRIEKRWVRVASTHTCLPNISVWR
jgi:hypothetical protein